MISETLKENDFFTSDQNRKLYRTELIARGRNIVLNLAMQPKYDEFHYVIMMDLDFGQLLDIDGILSSFNFTEEWDAICANGIAPNGEHWDWYAFRNEQHPFGPELYGAEWWKSLPQWRTEVNLRPSDPMLPVISAFGGLAIYKRDSMKECYYSGIVTEDLEFIMQNIINIDNPKSRDTIRYYFSILNKMESFALPNGYLRWFTTSHLYTEYPTVCEHVPFHASMIKKNHAKIFINPRMIMKY